jgi:hypothetical protein
MTNRRQGYRIDRRALISLVIGATTWPLAVRAQQKAMPMIGFFHPASPAIAGSRLDTSPQGLREVGYIEGQMAIRRCARNVLAILMWSLMTLVVSAQALAQGCRPVAERVGEQRGCWILADESLGLLPQTPLFWIWSIIRPAPRRKRRSEVDPDRETTGAAS